MAKKNRHKGPAIGGLADALLKAGVADAKVVNRTQAERRNEHQSLGRDGVAERERQRAASNHERQLADKQAAREREAALLDTKQLSTTRQLIKQHTRNDSGPKRWYFVTRDGRVPFLELSDMLTRLLGDGMAGIVESMGTVSAEHVVVADEQALVTLRNADPEIIRFWNHG